MKQKSLFCDDEPPAAAKVEPPPAAIVRKVYHSTTPLQKQGIPDKPGAWLVKRLDGKAMAVRVYLNASGKLVWNCGWKPGDPGRPIEWQIALSAMEWLGPAGQQ